MLATVTQQRGVLQSPAPSDNALFGDALVVGFSAPLSLSLAVVGQPGDNSVHVFRSGEPLLGTNYVLEATLRSPIAHLPQHRSVQYSKCSSII